MLTLRLTDFVHRV